MSAVSVPSRFLLVAILLLASASVTLRVSAAPPHQEATPTDETVFAPPTWVSPTPDELGRLSVIVQPGESLWIIAARAGLTLPELLALNDLTESSIIKPGDVIIIGVVTPAATAVSPEEATPTATRPPPTPRPTESRREAAICLAAFDDTNANGVQDTGEPLRAGVAFTVYNSNAVVINYITDGVSEPRCLGGLLPGDYRVTRSIAPGEALTTPGDWALALREDNTLYQSFGSTRAGSPATAAVAGPTQATPAASASPSITTPSPAVVADDGGGLAWRVAGIVALFLGGLLLLGAVLLLLRRQTRRPDAPGDSPDGQRRFQNLDDLE